MFSESTNTILTTYKSFAGSDCTQSKPILPLPKDFLCTLGHIDTRNIIDHYNRLPSNVYTEVINSLHTQDKAAFSATLKETDCQDLMGILWMMRYLLYGIQSEKDVRIIKRGKRIQLENLWLSDTGLSSFFRNIPKEEEERFTEERIRILCGFDTKSIARRQRIGRQQYDCEVIAETRPYTHYIDSKRLPCKQFLLDPEKDDTKAISLSSITYNCKGQTYKILLSALRSHKDAISQRIGNVGGKSFSVAIEQKCNDEEWDYVELECQDFLDFITLSLQQMKSVYLIVEGFLNEEDKNLLNWIVSLYTNDGQQEVLVDEYQKVSHEGQYIDNGNNTIPKGKWYVKVLDSKLRGNNSEEKNAELLRCLSLLYEELTKDSNNLIDTATPKDLFIYRFSGFNGPFPSEIKISWKGSNTFLGYITRCLISDKTNDPMGLRVVASFFHSKSGKPMNLSVKDYSFKDYEREKNCLHPDFVKAVELLRRCGFINVEYTSKRR